MGTCMTELSAESEATNETMHIRATCIHEAGHLVALQAYGGIGKIRIEKIDDRSRPDWQVVDGFCDVFRWPEGEHQRRVVNLAGLAAELLDLFPDATPSFMAFTVV